MMNLTNLIDVANVTIDKFDMLNINDIVVVGVSGGADSVALLHFLKFSKSLQVIACHINHKLRGEESYRDMDFVNNLCTKWDIPCFIREIDVALFADENSMGLEEAGRFLRYSEFDFIANQCNATKIATAHTLSDTAETMILNLTRGAGLQGLCGIPPIRATSFDDINIIRPLIDCSREQVEKYCAFNSIEFVNDSSNLSNDFSRNNIRNNVIPILKDINPAFLTAISRSNTLLNRDNDFINKEVSDTLFFCDEISFGCYDIATLPDKDVSVRSRVITSILDRHNIKKSFSIINSIDEMICLGNSGGKINVATDKFVQVKSNKLNIINSQDDYDYFENLLPTLNNYSYENPYEFHTPWGELLSFFVTTKEFIVKKEKIYKKRLLILLDYDKIEGSAFVRQRLAGDKINFSHRVGTKSLKKLFIDNKLSSFQKSKVLVFADMSGVFAVKDYGVSCRVAVNDDTRNFLVVLGE